MLTVIEKININNIDKVAIQKATNILKGNGIVAFPTETVYGLGANALEDTAVKKIYLAKGRPSDNPLIIHISSKKDIYKLVKNVPSIADTLIDSFWPGALTIIFPKTDIVPNVTSGNLNTVAIRMPKNKICLELIKSCGFPLAAPSANTSTKPSPTKASHVYNDLNGKIPMIIDGGKCSIGIESSVVTINNNEIIMLRAGGITKEMIQKILPNTNITVKNNEYKNCFDSPTDNICISPGMKYKHYAPNGELFLIRGENDRVMRYIKNNLLLDYKNNTKSLVICTKENIEFYKKFNHLNIGSNHNLDDVAKNLFDVLRQCDDMNTKKIYVQTFLEDGIGIAIMNRLCKASSNKIINV